MKKILIPLFLIIFLISCSSVKEVIKEVPIETVRTEYITQLQTDTVISSDSIFIKEANDTIYQYKFKYKYIYKSKTDTIEKNDTIEKPVYITNTEIQEVNKLTWYQKLLIWFGKIAILLFIFKLGKFIYSRGYISKLINMFKK